MYTERALLSLALVLGVGCSGGRREDINHQIDSRGRDAAAGELDAETDAAESSEREAGIDLDAEEELDASDALDVEAPAPGDAAASMDATSEDVAEAGTDAALDQGDADLDASVDSALGPGDAVVADAADAASEAGEDADAAVDPDAGVDCDAGVPGSRLEIQRDLPNANPERVTSLRWLNASSTWTDNLVGEASSSACAAGNETFGQSLAWQEGATPLAVGGLTRSMLTACGADTTITTLPNNCNGVAQLQVTTTYRLYEGARATELRVERTFGFHDASPPYTATVELAYVPRVRLALFPTVIYPNQAGDAVTAVAANTCAFGCQVMPGASWSGAWFADVNATTGQALIVLRDPSMTSPVRLIHNWDASSSSNLTAFGLVRPSDGWKAPLREVEYLCFADLDSWPQSMRDAAQLPTWCVAD